MPMDSTSLNEGEERGTQAAALAPARSPSPRELWRKAEALERLAGDEDLFWELCAIFLEESPKLLLQMRQAITHSDTDGLRRAAHSLKGELGYLGARIGCEISQKLEDMGHEKKLAGAAEVLTLLERELSDLYVVMKSDSGVPR